MNEFKPNENFSTRLLQQEEALQQPRYEEYRMQLEAELARAEQREKLVARIAAGSLIVAVLILPLAGTEAIGGFDPWNENANFLSISLGVIYVIAASTAAILIASYYSRFRPRTRQTRENLMQHSILELHQELRELRSEVESLKKPHDA
jgi:hypothetical protein